MRSADTGNVKSQCRAVVVNDVPDAYGIQYLQFLQSPVRVTARTELMAKEFVSIKEDCQIVHLAKIHVLSNRALTISECCSGKS